MKSKKVALLLALSLLGTSVLGGLCAYPIAILFMGKGGQVAFYAYIVPFLISTAAGAVICALLKPVLKKAGVLQKLSD